MFGGLHQQLDGRLGLAALAIVHRQQLGKAHQGLRHLTLGVGLLTQVAQPLCGSADAFKIPRFDARHEQGRHGLIGAARIPLRFANGDPLGHVHALQLVLAALHQGGHGERLQATVSGRLALLEQVAGHLGHQLGVGVFGLKQQQQGGVAQVCRGGGIAQLAALRFGGRHQGAHPRGQGEILSPLLQGFDVGPGASPVALMHAAQLTEIGTRQERARDGGGAHLRLGIELAQGRPGGLGGVRFVQLGAGADQGLQQLDALIAVEGLVGQSEVDQLGQQGSLPAGGVQAGQTTASSHMTRFDLLQAYEELDRHGGVFFLAGQHGGLFQQRQPVVAFDQGLKPAQGSQKPGAIIGAAARGFQEPDRGDVVGRILHHPGQGDAGQLRVVQPLEVDVVELTGKPGAGCRLLGGLDAMFEHRCQGAPGLFTPIVGDEVVSGDGIVRRADVQPLVALEQGAFIGQHAIGQVEGHQGPQDQAAFGQGLQRGLCHRTHGARPAVKQIAQGRPALSGPIETFQAIQGRAVVGMHRQHTVEGFDGPIVIGHLLFGQTGHLQRHPDQLLALTDRQAMGEHQVEALVIVGGAVAALEEVQGLAIAWIQGPNPAQIALDLGVIARPTGDARQGQTDHGLGASVAIAHGRQAHLIELAIGLRIARG